jgi:hypothetical protein
MNLVFREEYMVEILSMRKNETLATKNTSHIV